MTNQMLLLFLNMMMIQIPKMLGVITRRVKHISNRLKRCMVLVYGKCECFVMQILYVCVLCASGGSSQYLQFVNAGRGCKRRPYGRGILQSRSHN